jgi:hypothetical protein
MGATPPSPAGNELHPNPATDRFKPQTPAFEQQPATEKPITD